MSVPNTFKAQKMGPVGVAITLLVFIIVGVWAYAALTPRLMTVDRRDIVAEVPLKGDVIAPPSARADVHAPYDAPVERVLTTVGARVRRGDVLAELYHPSAEAALDQARAALQATETAYANASSALMTFS